MIKEFTCIVCPLGCPLSVEISSSGEVTVSGNTCPRGKEYGINEMTNPQRVITTTVRCSDGNVLPVKTSCPIPKRNMAECMKIINNFVAPLPICSGDVIIENVFGADVVATADLTLADS